MTGGKAMAAMTLAARAALAARLREGRESVAERVTEALLARHPDRLARLGESARTQGLEDAACHVDFLAGAVAAGAPAPFEDYARWAVRVRLARGTDGALVAEGLEQVGAACGAGLEGPARALVDGLVRAAVGACGAPDAGPGEAPAVSEALARARELFVQAILRGERRAALGVARAALREAPAPIDLYVEVFERSLHAIGRRWEANHITVADEHMATATVQAVIAQVYGELDVPPPTRGRIVIAGVQGEQHQVGANIVADVLEADGWSVRFLGVDMPHEGILRAVEAERAGVLGISCTMAFNLPRALDLVKAVRARLDGRPLRIVLGGRAFRAVPALALEAGADAAAMDARAAVGVLRPWSEAT